MYMGKYEMKSVLRSMMSIQRHAGYTISQVLGDAVPDHQRISRSGSYYGVWKLGPTVWDCNESPVLLCVYDSIEDPAMDQCIFCGDPEERK